MKNYRNLGLLLIPLSLWLCYWILDTYQVYNIPPNQPEREAFRQGYVLRDLGFQLLLATAVPFMLPTRNRLYRSLAFSGMLLFLTLVMRSLALLGEGLAAG